MRYIRRNIEQAVKDMAGWFPVVSITGPRQSGKSTLIKHVFQDYEYVNMEDQEIFLQAKTDPVGFIKARPNRLIIDEAQRVPELFSQIQVRSDEENTVGQYILTGSQNFTLLKSIKQSLAGRVGICRLMPFSYSEIVQAEPELDVDTVMFNGGYPRLYTSKIAHNAFFESYLDTNVVKDTAGLINEANLPTLQKFIKICAQYAGNLINISRMSNQAEITRHTAIQWLNILQTNYIIFELQPYFSNELKSLTKTHKLYFYDTGLLINLLGIKSQYELLTSPHLGQVYENFIISETIKRYLNANSRPNLYFYRDDSKIEVDLIDLTNRQNISLTEIKSGRTYNTKYKNHLLSVENKLKLPIFKKQIVMRIENSYRDMDVDIVAGKDYLLE